MSKDKNCTSSLGNQSQCLTVSLGVFASKNLVLLLTVCAVLLPRSFLLEIEYFSLLERNFIIELVCHSRKFFVSEKLKNYS